MRASAPTRASFVLIVAVALAFSSCGGDDDVFPTVAPQTTSFFDGGDGVVADTTLPELPEGFGLIPEPVDVLDTLLGSGEVADLAIGWLESYGMAAGGTLLDRDQRAIWFAPSEVCSYVPDGLLVTGSEEMVDTIISLAREEAGVWLSKERVVLDERAGLDLDLWALNIADSQSPRVDPYGLVATLERNAGFPSGADVDVQHVSFTAQRYMFGPGDEPEISPMTAEQRVIIQGTPPSAEVYVAVVDTGWGRQTVTTARDSGYDGHILPDSNEDLSAPGLREDQMSTDGSFPTGVFGHGDVVASIVNNRSSATMIWTRAGIDAPREVDLIQAIALAVGEANQASTQGSETPLIINLSLGTYACHGQPPAGLKALLDEVFEMYPKTVVVAAAGNDHVDDHWYPAGFAANYPNRVISVGALNTSTGTLSDSPKGQAAEFSNYGCVTTWAPGVDVRPSQWYDAVISSWSGTSMAAGWASGTIASVVEARVAAGHPADPVAAVDQLMKDSMIASGGC